MSDDAEKEERTLQDPTVALSDSHQLSTDEPSNNEVEDMQPINKEEERGDYRDFANTTETIAGGGDADNENDVVHGKEDLVNNDEHLDVTNKDAQVLSQDAGSSNEFDVEKTQLSNEMVDESVEMLESESTDSHELNSSPKNVDRLHMEVQEDNFLPKILSKDDLSLINIEIVHKIENAVNEKFNEQIAVQASLHTAARKQSEIIEELRADLERKTQEADDLLQKNQNANMEVSTFVEIVEFNQNEAFKANEAVKKMQLEWQDFKTQRDIAWDERESLLTMIERRDSEIATLTSEKAHLTKEMEMAVTAKIRALENSQEVESMKINIEHKERRLEQENALLRSQLEDLTEELNNKLHELSHARRQVGEESMALQSELGAKTEEVRILTETVTDLRETNDKLSDLAEKLTKKLASQRESYDAQIENFHQELTAQKKLAELYKGICNENDTKTEKLIAASDELKHLLDEATARYGELESKFNNKIMRYDEEVQKRDDCIHALKKELSDVNCLLQSAKQESIDSAISSLSPSAAAASRLIKSGMSLSQIFTLYVQASEKLALAEEESRRQQLYIATIVEEIEEKAPLLRQQRIDYEKAVEAANSLTQEMDRMVAESQQLSYECGEAKKTSSHLKKENELLKKQLVDHSRQVCYLVKAVEDARSGLTSYNSSYEMRTGSAQEVISKHLVTFASIEDLQENNQKLLALVRQLSEKHEAGEGVSTEQFNELQEQKDRLLLQVNEIMEDMDRQSKMLDLVRSQSDTYRKLYEQSVRGNTAEAKEDAAPIGTPVRGSAPLVTSTPFSLSAQHQPDEQNEKLKKMLEKIAKLEEELNENRSKSNKREEELIEKLEKVSSDSREWMFSNSKLVARAEHHEEKAKVLDTNIKALRKQLAVLEDRNRILSEINAKHEQSIHVLKDAAMDAQTRLSRSEVQADHLKQEIQLIKTSEARLIKELEVLNREKINNSMLMSNIDGLKATLLRVEEEGQLRLEVQLTNAVKECAALRNTLADEKTRFQQLTVSLERQTASAKERMEEEKLLAERARNEVLAVGKELEEKQQIITQLTNQIRELKNHPVRGVIQAVSQSIEPSAQHIKELEKNVAELKAEIARLTIQLNSAQSSNEQYIAICEASNRQMEQVAQDHSLCPQTIADLEKEREAERSIMEARITSLEQERDQMARERDTQLHNSSSNVDDLTNEIKSLQTELEDKQAELDSAVDSIKTLTAQLHKAQQDFQEANERILAVEARYSQEVVAHSEAIKSLNDLRAEFASVDAVTSQLKSELEAAQRAGSVQTQSWQDEKHCYENEIQKLTKQYEDLDAQNVSLHSVIQKLNEDLTLLQAKLEARPDSSDLETSLNLSAELSSGSQDHLMKVIKFLRQEKDIASTKSEVLQAESTRLKSQLALLQKQLDEANAAVLKSRETADMTESSAAKHVDLLRKVESLNSITDSNRLLREERNRYKLEIEELQKKLTHYEAGVNPLQAEIAALKVQLESANTEKDATAVELIRWKARTAQLSERGKVSPEEWKRVNTERENLAKLLQVERDSNEKLEKDLASVKNEVVALNTSVAELRKQSEADTEEKRRANEALNEQVAEAKTVIAAKETALTEMSAKETQIKKIAKKYKTQYEQLLKKCEEDKAAREEADKLKAEELQAVREAGVISAEEQERLRAEGRAQAAAQVAQTQATMEAMMLEQQQLQKQVAAAVSEAESLRKDNETLKVSVNEKEERAKNVLKNARLKIQQQHEELLQTRTQAEQSREELAALKLNHDSVVARMEKDQQDQVESTSQERKESELQIKMLTHRLSMLQKMVEKQKPSQSVTKSAMEPPTANIKPMAGSSTRKQQKQTPAQCVVPFWSVSTETPFARIGPVQTRTLAVQPTSVAGTSSSGSSAPSGGVLLAPLQQVHTTANSAEAPSSSPTSSHTDYMPATSSALPTRVVVNPTPVTAQSSQEAEATEEQLGAPAQAVAMITPRVELAAGGVAGPSSTTSQASSSNTVTTTQAGLKRPRDNEGDAGESTVSPQVKRTRGQQSEVFQQTMVSHSEGSEVEYQVPTSSQRDQEDDMVIMIGDSDDEDNADDGEGEEAEDYEEDDNGDGYEMEGYSRDGPDMGNAFVEEGPDIDQDIPEEEANNEVEIIDDSNEVPVATNQQQSSEATSSENDNSLHVVVTHAASSQTFRTRSVLPLRSHMGYSYADVGDDSIVPSTPTLFLPREAVSSPQVPQQRFTFSEPAGVSRRDDTHGEDSGGGRSVPTTPLVASPPDAMEQAEPSIAVAVPNIPANAPGESMTSTDHSGRRQEDREAPEAVNTEEDGDGVTSEGEKPPVVGAEFVEEGREAEASEPVVRRIGTARRSSRSMARRGSSRGRPIPIVWNEPGSSGLPANQRAGVGRSRGRPRRNWP